MNGYSIVSRYNFGMFGNYAFCAGDIDGDCRAEFAMCSREGDYLLVLDDDGNKAWDAFLRNRNVWGTTPLLIKDVNSDGMAEVLVAEDYAEVPGVTVFDGGGGKIVHLVCARGTADYDGAIVDSIGVARRSDGVMLVLALVNGGFLYAFEDLQAEPIWCSKLTTRYFEHYIHIGDLDGDGNDEILFTGSPGPGHDKNPPELSFLHVMDLQGQELWRKPLSEIAPGKPIDHLDFIAIAPVVRSMAPQRQIIASMGGCVLDASGNLVWSLNDRVGHCDWVETWDTSQGRRVLFSSHRRDVPILMADAEGNELWSWNSDELSAENCVTGQAHFNDWTGKGDIEIVTGEQIPGWWPERGHERPSTQIQTVNLFIMGLDGRLRGRIPLRETAPRGWFYNGENRSFVLDVDGDGGQEWVWQAQSGVVLVIKKEKGNENTAT